MRALRRRADLSQRQLAQRAGVPQTTVSRIETGAAINPSFRTVERLVRAAGSVLSLAGGPGDGPPALDQVTQPAAPHDLAAIPHEDWRDAGGRRYPAHLDVEVLAQPEHWWGAWWASTRIRDHWPLDQVPAATFALARNDRDERRKHSAIGARAVVHRRGAQWAWTAELSEGEVVGEVRAHLFDPVLDAGGMSSLVVVPGGTVVLDGIVVAASWRRRGIGRRLFAALRAEATVAVMASTADPGVQQFLSRCGFRPTRDFPAPEWFVSRPA